MKSIEKELTHERQARAKENRVDGRGSRTAPQGARAVQRQADDRPAGRQRRVKRQYRADGPLPRTPATLERPEEGARLEAAKSCRPCRTHGHGQSRALEAGERPARHSDPAVARPLRPGRRPATRLFADPWRETGPKLWEMKLIR